LYLSLPKLGTQPLQLDKNNETVQVTGFVDAACNFVDMDNGGLYIKADSHPFFLPPHQWMRAAAGWLLRAAHITFADGTRHLTPGYPTAYNGQWMRDGFYGISLLWGVANATHREDFGRSAEWMFGHARADGE
jgi:hypothetical protein